MTNKENIKQYFINEDENFSVYFEKDIDNHNYNIIICYEDYDDIADEINYDKIKDETLISLGYEEGIEPIQVKKTYKTEIQFKIISNALEAFHKLSTWSIKRQLPFYQRINLIEDMKQIEIELLKIVEEMKKEDNLL